MIVEYTHAARQAIRPATRGQLLRNGWINSVLGLGSVAWAAFLLVDMVTTRTLDAVAAILCLALLAVGGVLGTMGPTVISGAWSVRTTDPPPGYTYAFAIADGIVSFPAMGLLTAESWALAQTTASVTRSADFGTDQLELVTPQTEPREFPLESLKLPVGEILTLIETERVAPAVTTGAPSASGEIVVGLQPWTHETVSGVGHYARTRLLPGRDLPRLESRRDSRTLGCWIGAGGALVLIIVAVFELSLLAVGAVAGTVRVTASASSLIGVGVAVLIGAANVLLGRMSRDRALQEDRAAPAALGRYAFRISRVADMDVVVFDEGWGRDPEQWPLWQTTIQVVNDGEYGVELRCPGRTPRRFSAGALQLSPQPVVALVNSRR